MVNLFKRIMADGHRVLLSASSVQRTSPRVVDCSLGCCPQYERAWWAERRLVTFKSQCIWWCIRTIGWDAGGCVVAGSTI